MQPSGCPEEWPHPRTAQVPDLHQMHFCKHLNYIADSQLRREIYFFRTIKTQDNPQK